MLRAHADYATLDTGRYLAALEAGAQTAVQQDVQPKLHVPWRRFFARMIDLLLYDLTWMVILTSAGLCVAGNRGVTLLNDFLALLTMLLLEPLLLHLFGTTPGKWLMGLRVTDESGKTLPLAAAWRRTWRVLWYGYGACIPIYSIIRTYSCWKAEQAEQHIDDLRRRAPPRAEQQAGQEAEQHLERERDIADAGNFQKRADGGQGGKDRRQNHLLERKMLHWKPRFSLYKSPKIGYSIL